MSKEKFVLTKENYYSSDRPHISNSMINDYIQSPAFYKAKHIDKTIPRRVTDPMKRGSLVDAILTGEDIPYSVKVLKREDPELFEQQKQMGADAFVSQSIYDQAIQIAGDVSESDIWNDHIEDASMQRLLTGTMLGLPVCGLADRIDALGNLRYRIVDLKVVQAQKITSAKKWEYTCHDFGYFRQLAFYRHLLAAELGIPQSYISCGHICAAYVEEGLTHTEGFKILSPHLLDEAMEEIMEAMKGIQEGKFDEEDVSWNNAYTL